MAPDLEPSLARQASETSNGASRADVTVNTPPQTTVTCGGTKTWDSAYLQGAIKQATDFKAQNLLQGNSIPLHSPHAKSAPLFLECSQANTQPGKDKYPHVYENRPQQYLDGSGTQAPFIFPNCPTGELLEFPLMRDTTRYTYYSPGKTSNSPGTNNPDRVIMTYQGPTEATYCGVITHDGAEAKGLYKSDFLACDPLY
ncbi:MAG: hypothetical protein Q9199_003090 [Rusavskia elegans]